MAAGNMIKKSNVKGRCKRKKAFFITFEGLEGSGKSSVIACLARSLRSKGFSVRTFREPGSTKLGETIRRVLLDKKSNISSYAELLLYLAARTQLIEEKLINALGEYDIVICDRFYDSTIVYQGYGLRMGSIAWEAAKKFSLGIKPQVTLVLDSEVKQSLRRLKTKDRIESRSLFFHYRLKKGYRKIAKEEPKRIKLINADQKFPVLCENVKRIVEISLKRWMLKKTS